LAYERRNLTMLKEVLETVEMVTQQVEGEFLGEYGARKVKELETRSGR
jgi:hypothetical protein